MKILCVIVLYKLKLEESIAYSSFVAAALRRKEFGLLVYDNSPIASPPKSTEIAYVSDPSNPGISKAYNYGAIYAEQHGYDWLFFTDQDTYYPTDNYISLCHEALINDDSLSLFVPLVDTVKGIFSPLKTWHHMPGKFSYIIGNKNPLQNCAIINSGMVVRLSAFEKAGGYNEKVPLDYSDYQFIDRLQHVIDDFYLVNYHIKQSFSDEVDDEPSLLRRFKSIIISVRNFEGSFITRSDMKIILLKRCLSLTIRYKSHIYLKTLLFG